MHVWPGTVKFISRIKHLEQKYIFATDRIFNDQHTFDVRWKADLKHIRHSLFPDTWFHPVSLSWLGPKTSYNRSQYYLYIRSGVNQICILKNSKELLEHLQSPNFNHITSIESFHFSNLFTTIPHQKLKSRLATITETLLFTKIEIADTNFKF